MVLPLGPPMEGLTPPSSSAMRPRSCATCRSCSSSCSRCCSTFSWAIRCELSPVNAQRRRDAGCHARSSSGRSGTDRPRRCPESGCPWAGCAVAVVERRGHFAGMPWQKQVWGSSKRISNADTANLAVGIEAPSQAQVTSGALQLESHSCQLPPKALDLPLRAVPCCAALRSGLLSSVPGVAHISLRNSSGLHKLFIVS